MAIEFVSVVDGGRKEAHFTRSWVHDGTDVTRAVRSALRARARRTPVVEREDGRKVVVRVYGNVVFAVGVSGREDEATAFELIHLLVVCLDDHFRSVTEADVTGRPDLLARLLEALVCDGVLVATARAHIAKLLREL